MTGITVGVTADNPDGRITVECESFRGFLGSFSSLISTLGIFLPTDAPQPTGSCVRFSVGLGPDFPLLRGIGEVVWTVEPGDDPAAPPGMAVRHLILDPATVVLIDKIRERGRREGVEAFRLDAPPACARRKPARSASARPTAVEAAPAEPVQPAEPVVEPLGGTARGGGGLSWAATLLVGLALGGAGYWLQGALESRQPETEKPVAVAQREPLATAASLDLTDRETSLRRGPRAPGAVESRSRRAGQEEDRAIARIERIDWVPEPDSTLVIVRADAPWSDDRYRVSRVDGGAPRVLIEIFDVAVSLPPRLEVGSRHLARLRTGLHGTPDARELHVVADLAGPDVGLATVETHGPRLELRFGDARP